MTSDIPHKPVWASVSMSGVCQELEQDDPLTIVLEQAAQPTTGQEVKASILPTHGTQNGTRLSALVIPVVT